MKAKKLLSSFLALYLVLGTWKGYLALFQAGETEPQQIFPRTADSLPDTDRVLLEEGIVIRNDRDLQSILEDYLS